MAVLKENAAMITPQFIEVFNSVLAQGEQQPEEVRVRLEEAYRTVLRLNMSQNLAK